MNRIARLAMVASAAVGLVASVAHAQAPGAGKPTIAVMSFNNNAFTSNAREYDGLSKGVADFLVTEMATNPSVRVIERDQVQKLVDEQRLVSGGQVDKETAIRVGKLLGAQHMIFGGFMADPRGNFRIDARAVNVETGQIVHTDRVQDKADNVMSLIEQLAAKLNAGMKLPAMPLRIGDGMSKDGRRVSAAQAGAPAAAPAPTPVAAPSQKLPMKYAVMYGKALDLADRGEKERAVELFGAVLKDFPDFGPAKSGMSKLKPAS